MITEEPDFVLMDPKVRIKIMNRGSRETNTDSTVEFSAKPTDRREGLSTITRCLSRG